jgi:hypothetical protein
MSFAILFFMALPCKDRSIILRNVQSWDVPEETVPALRRWGLGLCLGAGDDRMVPGRGHIFGEDRRGAQNEDGEDTNLENSFRADHETSFSRPPS